MRKKFFIAGALMTAIVMIMTTSGCGKQDTVTNKHSVEITSESDTTAYKAKNEKEKSKKEKETTTAKITETASMEAISNVETTTIEETTAEKESYVNSESANSSQQDTVKVEEAQPVAAVSQQAETYAPVETQPLTETQTPTPQPEPQPEPETTTSGSPSVLDVVDGVHLEYDMLGYVNEARRNEGLKELEWDYSAEEGCKTRAQELAVCYDHHRPDGSNETTAFPRSTMTNIGKGPFSAYAMFQAWMESTPHRGLILTTGSEDTIVTIDTLYNPNTGGYYNKGDVIPGNTIKFCCASYDNYWVMSISTY